MFSMCLGIAGFVLYFIYDINSFTKRSPVIHSFFMIGTLLIGIATIMDLRSAWKEGFFSGIGDCLLMVGAVVCFAALIYCLFFALPFQETYAEQHSGRRVYDGGVYALCRHPGILCFFCTYLMLGIAALPGRMIINSMFYSVLNLAYAYFQDRVTFPKTFCDYADYQKKVPFLIPTKASIRLAQQTLFHSDN